MHNEAHDRLIANDRALRWYVELVWRIRCVDVEPRDMANEAMLFFRGVGNNERVAKLKQRFKDGHHKRKNE